MNIYDPSTKTYTAGTQEELNKAMQKPGAIAVDTLTSNPQLINVPTPPPAPNYTAPVNAGNAMINAPKPAPAGWDAVSYANFKAANPNLEPTQEDTIRMQQANAPKKSVMDTYASQLQNDNITMPNAPKALSGEYGTAYKSQVSPLEQTALASSKNLGLAQAKLAAINAEGQAAQLALQGQGRGIPASIIGGQQAQIARETAIKAIPVQAEIMAAQAIAQGDQAALKATKDHLDTAFSLYKEDVNNQFNYDMKVYDNAMANATQKQKDALQAVKDEIALNQKDVTDALNNAQSVSKMAFDSGDMAMASAITALKKPDPRSATFAQDLNEYNKQLANFQSKITPESKYEFKSLQDGRDVMIDKFGNIKMVLGTKVSEETKKVLKEQQASIDSIPPLVDKINTISNLINSPGMQTAVGTSFFSREPITFSEKVLKGVVGLGIGVGTDWAANLTGAKQNFISGIEQLVSRETLDSLINLKAQGGTLGALSDQEKLMLQNAATKIGGWSIVKDGKVVGYNASERDFKQELNRIKDLTIRALNKAKGITPENPMGLDLGNTNKIDPLNLGI